MHAQHEGSSPGAQRHWSPTEDWTGYAPAWTSGVSVKKEDSRAPGSLSWWSMQLMVSGFVGSSPTLGIGAYFFKKKVTSKIKIKGMFDSLALAMI